MLKNMLSAAALSGALALTAFPGAAHAQSHVSFVEPKDGATVTSPVHVKFAVEGMKIAPAGTMTEGTGHHHLLIDSGPLPKGTVIPASDTSLHYGTGRLNAGMLATIPAPVSKVSVPSVLKPNQPFALYFDEYSNAKTLTRLYKDGKIVKTFTNDYLRNGTHKYTYALKEAGTYKLVFATASGRHTRVTERVITVK